MVTIKSYTSVEQSRKLAEILPIESADGFWEYHNKWCSEGDEWEDYEDYPRAKPYLEYTRKENEWKEDKSDVPCWSLAALLKYLSEIKPQEYTFTLTVSEGKWCLGCMIYGRGYIRDEFNNEPIDVCYEMILKLHEFKML